MMKDIDENELRNIMQSSKKVSNSDEISDSKLIEMVQMIKDGKADNLIMEKESENFSQKTVESKTVSNQFVNKSVFELNNYSDSNSNYWKITGLPSKGKFYPEGTEILGRPLKVLEVKKISSINEENGDFIINDIIKRTTKGLVFDEMYVADKLYIVFWLRANTYRESGYVVPFICNKCGKKSEYHFEVNNLEVQEISDDFSPSKDVHLPNGDVIRYDYLRVKDELFIDRFMEINSNAVGEIDKEILSIAQMVKTLNGRERTLLEKYHWIIEMDPGSYSYLRNYIEKKGMGIKPYVNVNCKQCGGTAIAAVSFREDFFIPEIKLE